MKKTMVQEFGGVFVKRFCFVLFLTDELKYYTLSHFIDSKVFLYAGTSNIGL